MTQETAEPAALPHIDGDEAASEPGVGESFARLYADGRAYAEAEIAKQKARAGIVAGAVRTVAVLAVVAIVLLFAAIVAALVGLVLALTPVLGALGATGAVFGGTLLVVLLLLLLAKFRIDRMNRDLRP